MMEEVCRPCLLQYRTWPVFSPGLYVSELIVISGKEDGV